MPKRIHLIAGILAPLCIATLFQSGAGRVVRLPAAGTTRRWIVTPGLWVLIPTTARAAAPPCRVAVVCWWQAKKAHALHCRQWAAGAGALRDLARPVGRRGAFDTPFYVLQVVELVAGGQLTLMGSERATPARAAVAHGTSRRTQPPSTS
jgi:hypothetical protein